MRWCLDAVLSAEALGFLLDLGLAPSLLLLFLL
jgi:hypothetical protein